MNLKTGPAEGAADLVKGAADEEPPTVLLGALKVKVPPSYRPEGKDRFSEIDEGQEEHSV